MGLDYAKLISRWQSKNVGDAIVGTSAMQIDETAAVSFANGTGSGQANWLGIDYRTVAASATDYVDLAISDKVGNATGPSGIKAIRIRADAANPGDLLIGPAAANGFVSPFNAAADRVRCAPGGVVELINPTAAGWDLSAGRVLQVSNSSGTGAGSYKVEVLGTANAAVYPLDQAGALPVFAYGAKKLTATYNGPALQVVRPSDSATMDIGFVRQNLDEAALSAFLGTQVGQVAKWYDQTGNGNHATQTTSANQPRIGVLRMNGGLAVYFGSNTLNLPAGVSFNRQTTHIFAVAEPLNSQSNTAFIQLGTGTTNQSTIFTGPLYLRLNPGTGNSAFPPLVRAAFIEGQSSSTQALIAQNGESLTGAAATSVTMTGGYIGNTDLGGGYAGQFYGAMFAAYNRILSSTEKANLKSACESLFSIWPSVTNTLVFEGDSITACSNPPDALSYGYAKMAERQLTKKVRVFSTASGGTQLQNDLPTYSSQAGAILSHYSSDNRVVFLHMGTNDLTIGGRTAAQIYSDIQTYAGDVRASGGKIIVSTILPNNAWNSTQIQTQQDLNTSIRNGWSGFADGFADFAADPTMGPQSAAANTALYEDGLHPTVKGYSILAPIAAAAINALLV